MKPPWERALFGVVNQAGAILKRDNAITPIAAFCLLAAGICFAAGYWMPALQKPLVYFGAILLAFPILAYFILLIRDPNRLQSEKYQLTQAKLQQFVLAKELSRPLAEEELTPPISNPALPRLKPPSEEQQ